MKIHPVGTAPIQTERWEEHKVTNRCFCNCECTKKCIHINDFQ